MLRHRFAAVGRKRVDLFVRMHVLRHLCGAEITGLLPELRRRAAQASPPACKQTAECAGIDSAGRGGAGLLTRRPLHGTGIGFGCPQLLLPLPLQLQLQLQLK